MRYLPVVTSNKVVFVYVAVSGSIVSCSCNTWGSSILFVFTVADEWF